jgi:hypothetical protein
MVFLQAPTSIVMFVLPKVHNIKGQESIPIQKLCFTGLTKARKVKLCQSKPTGFEYSP